MRRLPATKTLGRLKRQQPRVAGQLDQLGPQPVVRAVTSEAGIGLIRHDLFGDKCADLVAQRGQVGRYVEIDHLVSISVNACSNRRTVAACSRSPTSCGALPA